MVPKRRILIVGAAVWLGEVRFVVGHSFCHRKRAFAVTESQTVDNALERLAEERFDCIIYANRVTKWGDLMEAAHARNEPIIQICASDSMEDILAQVRAHVHRKHGPRKGITLGPRKQEVVEAKEAA